jgi:hypothetical protein
MSDATGVTEPGGEAHPEIEVPDELHRRTARPGPDGTMVEVLAARRGVTVRPGATAVAGGSGDLNPLSIAIGFVIDLVVTVVTNAVIEVAAEGRPWKVKVYRMRKFPVQRLYSEVLPRGVEPDDRMRELLDQYAPPGS